MFFPELVEWNIQNFIIRIISSLILGAAIGLDRGTKRRGAGAKTCTVMCLGSTLVMLTAQYMQVYFPDKADMARLAAQVISGVGFLGVGTIMITGQHQVRGLTTAASLWTCACIGLAVGIGFIDGAFVITACVLLSLHILPAIEKLISSKSKHLALLIEFNESSSITDFISAIKDKDIEIDYLDLLKGKKSKNQTAYITLHLPTSNKEEIINYIFNLEQVNRLEEI